MNEFQWKLVRTENFTLQAEIMRGLLEAQDIRVLVSSEGYRNAIGLDGPHKRGIQLLVPSNQEALAMKFLAAYDAGTIESVPDDSDTSN